MTELDSLFKLDGDLDTLDKTVHQKYDVVATSQYPRSPCTGSKL
jgi:hypothetical protein